MLRYVFVTVQKMGGKVSLGRENGDLGRTRTASPAEDSGNGLCHLCGMDAPSRLGWLVWVVQCGAWDLADGPATRPVSGGTENWTPAKKHSFYFPFEKRAQGSRISQSPSSCPQEASLIDTVWHGYYGGGGGAMY